MSRPVGDHPSREGAHVCPLIIRYCKRGHPRNTATTFERKVRVDGKDYIVRECRVCHAMRSNKGTPYGRKFQSRSKWAPLRGDQ